MKEFMQMLLLGITLLGTFMCVLLNGYPEPFGVYLGIVCGIAGTILAGKEIRSCLKR